MKIKTFFLLLLTCLTIPAYAKIHIGIFTATEFEFNVLKDRFASHPSIKEQTLSNFTYFEIDNYVIANCNIGKVNAALCVNTAIENFALDEVIFIGLAGSLQEDLKPTDILIVQQSCQHDYDTSPWDGKKGLVPGSDNGFFHSSQRLVEKYKQMLIHEGVTNVHVGTIATGDRFTQNDLHRQEMLDICQADAADMETAAAAQATIFAGKEFVGIRVISNRAGEGGLDEYEDMTQNNMKHLAAVIAAITS